MWLMYVCMCAWCGQAAAAAAAAAAAHSAALDDVTSRLREGRVGVCRRVKGRAGWDVEL